jgi:hypothetical protein
MKRIKPKKLGSCLYCMRWSIRGTIAAWSLVVLLSVVWPNPTTLILAIFVAASFTVLTAMHSAVFAVRIVRKSPETSDLGRRQLLARFVRVSAMVFISSFEFGVLPQHALGQGSGLRPQNRFCVRLCEALFPRGHLRDECISEGAQGHGICVEGPCVPAPDPAEGFKPKTDQQTKLAKLLANNPIPSTLAGSYFRLAHRFTLGRAPANDLEASVFEVLDGLSPDVQTILECSLRRFDALPIDDRRRLFGPAFAELVDAPVSADSLAPMVADEIIQRASLATFGDPECATNERPGRPRLIRGGIDSVDGFFNVIHRVEGLRTAAFRPPPGEPPLTAADLTSEEVEHQCTLDPQGRPLCSVQTTNCPGQSLGGVCLRVPEIVAGDSVLLEGFNFFDVNAHVRLIAQPAVIGGVVRDNIEAHVCGDITTPVTEIVDGQERVIADSRVKDRLSFTVPEDLPAGIYTVFVTVSGSFTTGALPFIRVVPPRTATFEIASEQLDCVDETDPESFLGIDEGASDEVGISIITVAGGRDFSMGEMRRLEFRSGDVDSGDSEPMRLELFMGSDVGGVVMTIVGFEIDSEEAFKRMIDSHWEAFKLALEQIWKLLVAAAGLGGTVGALAKGASLKVLVVIAAIAAAIAAAYIIFFAVWAPPDLIIEDRNASIDLVQLGQLTSGDVPNPSVKMYTSPNDIDVTVAPIDKRAAEYFERRRYRSDDEDSTYEITLRYTRLL